MYTCIQVVSCILYLSLSPFLSLPPSLSHSLSVVTIGFEQADFSTVESSGQVTVCSQLNGVLSVPVTVFLEAQAEHGSATGMSIDHNYGTNEASL